MNDALKAASVILESLRLYTLVLNQKNSNITKCEDSVAKCFAISGKKFINKIIIICAIMHYESMQWVVAHTKA